jgi:2-succinyl-6-hydroxy-2,4-cyclohexadiene-1-carboxylate synthase
MSAPRAFTQPLGEQTYRIAHWTGSSDQTIVGLHGFTGAGTDFAPLASRLKASLYAPDLLGHAGSEAPRTPEPYAFDRQASTVPALVRTLGLSKPVLLGYSFGGRLALGALTADAGAFAAAILIGATAGLETMADRNERADADRRRAATIERDGVESFLAEWARHPVIASQARIDATHREEMKSARKLHSSWGLAHSLREAGTGAMPSLWDRLSEITVPVLLLTGAEDLKFGALASRLAERLPHATQTVIAGAGHCAHLERPDATATEIGAFLAANVSP